MHAPQTSHASPSPRLPACHRIGRQARAGRVGLPLGNRLLRLRLTAWCLLAAVAACGLASIAVRASEELGERRAARADLAEIEARVAHSAEFLASDELEGRGAGTKGLEAAADFIADEFQQIGLNTTACRGTPFQTFTATIGSRPGAGNVLVFRGPKVDENAAEPEEQTVEAVAGEDFSPLAMSSSGRFDLALVFAGYGISAPKIGYDDYQGIDVKGKAVVILRHEPQQDDADSPFNGTKDSPYAPLSRKLAAAFEHEAAAVILCTDRFEIEQELAEARKQWLEALDHLDREYQELKRLEQPTPEQLDEHRRRIDRLLAEVQRWSDQINESYDPLLPFRFGGRSEQGREMPVLHCRREVLDRVLQAATGTDLAALEAQIDQGPAPQSRELPGWRISGQVEVERLEVEMRNVVAVLDGAGPNQAQTIVLGAHYDHVGRTSSGRPDPLSSEGPICNGADDNASGVAVMLEVARRLARRGEKLPRRVVFIAFAGEETGLLGSSFYVAQAVVPLEQTVAMLNLDMVGRMRDEKLLVLGSQSGRQFGELLERANRAHGLNLSNVTSRAGASDHLAFYNRKIPVMHFFTGLHEDYHRPTDDVEKLNLTGMAQVARFVEDVVVALAERPQPPEFVQLPSPKPGSGGGNQAYLGTMPDFAAQNGRGYAIAGVAAGGPADEAGLRAGDVVVRFGKSKIGGLADMQSALGRHKPGQRVRVVVLRDGQERTFEVTLGQRR